MNYKVCILAAGIGSRMEPFTDSINKSLLPVNFKAVISHIIEKFDTGIELVIAVGHLKETVLEYLECAHKNRKITIVHVENYSGDGSGPGYSLMQCQKYLNQPFIFFTSDTIVDEIVPPPSCNWLGIAEVSNSKNYSTVDIKNKLITSIVDKGINNNKDAFIGLAGVKDHEIFFQALSNEINIKKNDPQVLSGFSSLIKYKLLPKKFTWSDTGNLAGYLKVNKKMSKLVKPFDFSKSDEFLYFVNKDVIKYFKDKSILENRFKRSKILNNLCPKITFAKDFFYSYKKVDGEVLYDVINEKIMNNFIEWLDKNLWIKKEITEDQQKNFKKDCFNFYYNKTTSRIQKYEMKYKTKDSSSVINGIEIPSIEILLNQIDWTQIVDGIPSNFHGDLQFDNVLMTKSNNFLLLDWRQDFSGNIYFGDQYYDLAKLNGGMIVSYKLIKENYFLFSTDFNKNITIQHKAPKELHKVKLLFENYLSNNDLSLYKVRIITGLVFLSMSPMHNEPFDHFIYNLGKLILYDALENKPSIHHKIYRTLSGDYL